MAEKGSEAVLARCSCSCASEGRLPARLLLGCPEAEVLALWQQRGFEVVDTTRREAYLAALDRCDLVILNYQRERYEYRPSGVAADALARGAAVVCPDFPLMRQQLTAPAVVGAVFEQLDDLERAVTQALALRAAAAPQRSPRISRPATRAAIARLLDGFVAARSALSERGSPDFPPWRTPATSGQRSVRLARSSTAAPTRHVAPPPRGASAPGRAPRSLRDGSISCGAPAELAGRPPGGQSRPLIIATTSRTSAGSSSGSIGRRPVAAQRPQQAAQDVGLDRHGHAGHAEGADSAARRSAPASG